MASRSPTQTTAGQSSRKPCCSALAHQDRGPVRGVIATAGRCMHVQSSVEVREWLEGLDDQRWAPEMFHLDLLEERGASR